MSISYRIYANTGAGDAVDYSAAVDTTSALTWTSPPLAPSSDWTFAVRAYDTISLLEDRNTDARARVLVGASGEDLTGLPNAPIHLAVRATAGGTAEVEWSYNAAGQGEAPTGFHVYAGTPAVSYAVPAATVAYVDARTTYRATLTGLVDAIVYEIAVRALNLSGEESNAATVTVTASTTGPDPVDDLAAEVIA